MNNKLYIGKTEYVSPEERWRQHLKEYKKERCEKRPLYSAMSKYGEEHFHFEIIEETDNPEEREKYWIEKLCTYVGFDDCNGYNATLGGDGVSYIDYCLVIKTYEELKNQKEVARKLHIDKKTVRTILKNNHIKRIKNIPNSKKIAKYDLNGVFIKSYLSASEAAKEIIEEGITKANCNSVGNRIRECSNGKLKTSYGYIWRFIDDINII